MPPSGLLPGSTRYPSASLYPAELPWANRFPSTTLYPSGSFYPSTRQKVFADGIATGEAHGSSTVSAEGTIAAAGIPSAEAHGSSTLSSFARIAPAGIGSGELHGSSTLTGVARILVDGIPSGEAFGDATLTMSYRIAAAGIPSEESIPGRSGFPSSLQLPSESFLPTQDEGVRIVPGPVQVSAGGIESAEVVSVSTFSQHEFIPLPTVGPVGPPRVGLRAGVGKQPGHLTVGGSDLEPSPITYKRIQFPSESIYPSRGLYPSRQDLSPISRNGAIRFRGRMSWQLARDRHYRSFVAQYVMGGKMAMNGVFLSDLYGRLPRVVEFSDGYWAVEMERLDQTLTLETLDMTLEIS